MSDRCNIFWGSHGCSLEPGHDGQHLCLPCCRTDDARHMRRHLAARADQYGADGCAGTWPYYGRDKMSGPDAQFPFFGYEAPDWEFVHLPDEFARLEGLR